MKSNQAKYRIATLCRTLEISASGYYAWAPRPPSARKISDMLLGDRIEANWRESRETYDVLAFKPISSTKAFTSVTNALLV